MARYASLIAWAEKLGRGEVVDILAATLEEEVATDEALTSLGEAGVNEAAKAHRKDFRSSDTRPG